MPQRRLVCVGVNHRSCPVELREKVAFPAERIEEALKSLRTIDGIGEALVVNTCNRVELYAAGDADTTPYQLGTFLHRFHGLKEGVLDEHLFRLVGEDAVSHLFRVAASLDAIVVGEPQILGQVKDAFFAAAGTGTTGPVLNRVFHKAFTVAKRVRTETKIASSAVSVSYAGVELARKIFGDLSGLSVLLVGAGDMGELAARHFMERGARLLVANRSFERAARLAEQFGGAGREMNELPQLLTEVDVVLVSTGAPHFVVTHDMVKKAAKARRWKPLFLIDIAVPRNVDPACGKLDGMYVYDVDDLAQVVEENLDARRSEADRAEDMVRDEVLKFAKSSRELQAVPLIKALRKKLLEIAEAEAQRTLGVLPAGDEKAKKSVQAMAQSIVNKALHEPTTKLKALSAKGEGAAAELFQALEDLFGLEIGDDEAGPADSAAVMREAEAAERVLDAQLAKAQERTEEKAAR